MANPKPFTSAEIEQALRASIRPKDKPKTTKKRKRERDGEKDTCAGTDANATTTRWMYSFINFVRNKALTEEEYEDFADDDRLQMLIDLGATWVAQPALVAKLTPDIDVADPSKLSLLPPEATLAAKQSAASDLSTDLLRNITTVLDCVVSTLYMSCVCVVDPSIQEEMKVLQAREHAKISAKEANELDESLPEDAEEPSLDDIRYASYSGDSADADDELQEELEADAVDEDDEEQAAEAAELDTDDA